MLSSPRKPSDQDPDASDTGFSALSYISNELNTIDFFTGESSSTGLSSSTTGLSLFADQFNIEEEGRAIGVEELFPPLHLGHPVHAPDPLGVLITTITTADAALTSASTTSTTWTQAIANPPLAAWNEETVPPSKMAMPVAEAVELPEGVDLSAALQGSKFVSSSPMRMGAANHAYQVVEGLIVLSNPNVVTAPMRIKIHNDEFGATNADGKKWIREDIAFKFKDMIGHGKKCLVHGLDIKSGSQWHCKGKLCVNPCAPCKVLKILKQIGCNLHVAYQGGIPRMMLDIATVLHLHTVDYRDLKLIFEAATLLCYDMTSCCELWAACLQDASGNPYLVANKRFYGCLMHPTLGHRPGSDKAEHAASKGLANLWHEIHIWRDGKYLTFTQKTRYMNVGDKIVERSVYQEDVINASTEHVKKIRPDWVKLAKKSWEELESVRNKLFKKTSVKKRKKSYTEDEGDDD